MRKFFTVFLGLVLVLGLLSGCGSQKKPASESAKVSAGEVQDKNKKESTNQDKNNKDGSSSKTGKSKVFNPDELLSEEEAAQIIGTKVTLHKDTLKIDSKTGLSNTNYEYKYSESTDIVALFLLKQNGATSKEELEAGETAESAYGFEVKMSGTNAEPVTGLGSKAFVHKLEAQVNVLYGDYYFMVGFGGDDKVKAREINLKIAKKIIENIDKKK